VTFILTADDTECMGEFFTSALSQCDQTIKTRHLSIKIQLILVNQLCLSV